MAEFTLFTYTIDGLPDEDHPPRLYAGQLTLEQVRTLTHEDCYPRQAVADYRYEPSALDQIALKHGAQLTPQEAVFIVSYSNVPENEDTDPDYGPDAVDGGSGMEFTSDHKGVGALQVQVWYLDARQVFG